MKKQKITKPLTNVLLLFTVSLFLRNCKKIDIEPTDIKTENNTNEISNQVNGDCSWYCLLGCGSNWGCCGNYSGCCLYNHLLCLIHDALCTNCEPIELCFKGCVPDKKT